MNTPTPLEHTDFIFHGEDELTGERYGIFVTLRHETVFHIQNIETEFCRLVDALKVKWPFIKWSNTDHINLTHDHSTVIMGDFAGIMLDACNEFSMFITDQRDYDMYHETCQHHRIKPQDRLKYVPVTSLGEFTFKPKTSVDAIHEYKPTAD